MSKSQSHKNAQSKAAGKNGRIEHKLKNNKILDAITNSGKKATEVERGGTQKSLESAVRRLRAVRSKQKVLQVPQRDIAKAIEAMKKIGLKGTVKNMSGTKRKSV